MKNRNAFVVAVLALIALPLLYNNCSNAKFVGQSPLSQTAFFGGGPTPTPTPTPTGTPTPGVTAIPFSSPLPIMGTEANVVPIVQGSGYVNQPTVTVTVCQPGAALTSSNCVAIPNVLLDTGSYGLRIFKSLVPFTLPAESDPSSGNQVAECLGYVDGASDWGGVVTADVVFGTTERAPNVPVQMIDPNFGNIPDDCQWPDTDPASSGYNGVLGVGGFQADCGYGCTADLNNRVYFQCTSSVCHPIGLDPSLQVSNPVYALPTDNNGVILQIANVSTSGASSMSGFLVLGIGTGSQSDNSPPTGVTVFDTDQNFNFQTIYQGQTLTASFIDSGSNMLYFNDPNIPQCSDGSGLYCPSGVETLNAIQADANGGTQDLIPFPIANGQTIEFSGNSDFNDAAAVFSFSTSGQVSSTSTFDWGLPFFFGKTVYVGYDGQSTSLGAGPFWAF